METSIVRDGILETTDAAALRATGTSNERR